MFVKEPPNLYFGAEASKRDLTFLLFSLREAITSSSRSSGSPLANFDWERLVKLVEVGRERWKKQNIVKFSSYSNTQKLFNLDLSQANTRKCLKLFWPSLTLLNSYLYVDMSYVNFIKRHFVRKPYCEFHWFVTNYELASAIPNMDGPLTDDKMLHTFCLSNLTSSSSSL